MIQIKTKKNNIGSKPLNVFDYLKGLSQEAKDLIIELDDVEDDLDKERLIFVDRNRENLTLALLKVH